MKKIVFLMICSMLLLSSCGNAEIVSQPSLSESIVQSSVDSSEEDDELWEKMNQAEEKLKADMPVKTASFFEKQGSRAYPLSVKKWVFTCRSHGH